MAKSSATKEEPKVEEPVEVKFSDDGISDESSSGSDDGGSGSESDDGASGKSEES